MLPPSSWLAYLAFANLALCDLKVTDIQGPSYASPLLGQTVNVTGVVAAVTNTSQGFYIVGEPSSDIRISNGLNVFTTSKSILTQVSVGDNITVTGKVSEFRSASSPNDLSSTEISSPKDIVIHSSNNTVKPVVLGERRSPPTQLLSALDVGADGFLSVPNNRSLQDTINATLQPTKYGMDFWESLEGQLVTVTKPASLGFQNNFGEFWVHGDWPVTGKNSRGGLTITFGPGGIPDANSEAIIVGQPIDGSKNPNVTLGQKFQDITGVIQFQFGLFYILPLTSPKLLSSPSYTVPPASIKPQHNPCVITLGDYNIDNFAPNSTTMSMVAGHIAKFLNSPDIVFLQEIQDNSGPTDDGIVDANVTLKTLADNIVKAGGAHYNFLDINPVNNEDGGQPGGNIRQAYLYRPEKLKLAGTTNPGGALDSTAVVAKDGKLGLTLNPGRIDPTNAAWNDSRKPLVAVWESALPGSTGDRLFTINLHLTSKDGSSSIEGNARPPVNLGIDQRTSQVNVVADFVKTILGKDRNANLIVAGDHNEFLQARSAFKGYSGILTDIDEVVNVSPVERYTYIFDQSSEQLDHIFLSQSLAKRKAAVQHVHVNNWAPSLSQRGSDHDPTVAQVDICRS